MISSSFFTSLKDYYLKTKDQKSDQKGILVYHQGCWCVTNLNSPLTPNVVQDTLNKILSLNIGDIPSQRELIYWIESFNYAMALAQLKDKKIKPIEKSVQNVQFNSMNEYAWLSNFFITVIYDPKYKLLYPSVENGYVAFKGRKGNLNELEIVKYAHTIGSKQVKQMGHSLWKRETEEDESEAIAEMSRLVTLKFQQNPFIRGWLKKSEARLEEFTTDSFWGSANGTCFDENSNHLGKIIQNVRSGLA